MTGVTYPKIDKEKNLPVYVTGTGISCAVSPSIDNEDEENRLLITVGGCGVIRIGDKEYLLPAGSGFYASAEVQYTAVASDKNHRTRHPSSDDEWLTDWVTFLFSSELMQKELFGDEDFVFFTFASPAEVSASVRKIGEYLETDERFGGFSASAEIYSLLINLKREMLELPKTAERVNGTIGHVVEYIDENYTGEITLADLCVAAGGISEQYLCRLFKHHMGERPIEYILHKRIILARSYLEKTDMPISDIASLTGFNNTSYFYRNFKKFTGLSPLECRQGKTAGDR